MVDFSVTINMKNETPIKDMGERIPFIAYRESWNGMAGYNKYVVIVTSINADGKHFTGTSLQSWGSLHGQSRSDYVTDEWRYFSGQIILNQD